MNSTTAVGRPNVPAFRPSPQQYFPQLPRIWEQSSHSNITHLQWRMLTWRCWTLVTAFLQHRHRRHRPPYHLNLNWLLMPLCRFPIKLHHPHHRSTHLFIAGELCWTKATCHPFITPSNGPPVQRCRLRKAHPTSRLQHLVPSSRSYSSGRHILHQTHR